MEGFQVKLRDARPDSVSRTASASLQRGGTHGRALSRDRGLVRLSGAGSRLPVA